MSSLFHELSSHLEWKKSRINCLLSIIFSLINYNHVGFKHLSLGISSDIKCKSKMHHIYRFFREQTFNYDIIAKIIMSFFNQDKYILTMDRTNWKLGKTHINILFLCIVIKNLSVPIYWINLGKAGNSSADNRLELLNKFINNFGVGKIAYFLADREFSSDWLYYFKYHDIDYIIPIKKNILIKLDKNKKKFRVDKIFNGLLQNEYVEYRGIYCGKKVIFCGSRNDKGELMVLVASGSFNQQLFKIYKQRWSIESLFKYMKTQGFNLEDSHMIKNERFNKLLACIAISTAIIIKQGLIKNERLPIKIKKHKRPQFSLFSYGIQEIKDNFSKLVFKINKKIRDIFQIHDPHIACLEIIYQHLL